MPISRLVPTWMRRFARDEDGVMTAYNLILTLTVCAIGAAGLDVTHFYAARTELQVAADIGAHTALFTRHRGRTTDQAKTAAVSTASYGKSPAFYGTVLEQADIVFGSYNATTRVFTPQTVPGLPSAAAVITNRADDNPVGSFLFRIVGINRMNVRASAIYSTYYDQCETDGLMAEGIVDIESMNAFFRGFCVHSNRYVSASQNNSFERGTIVSMPDKNMLDIPNSGFQQNPGLEQALRNANYDLRRELNRLYPAPFVQQQGIENYYDANSRPYHPETAPRSPNFIDSSAVVELPPGTLTADNFTPRRIHRVTCAGTSVSRLTLRAGTRPYRDMVLFTDCPIQFDGDVLLTNATISTTNTDIDSIQTPSGNNNGLQLGVDDDCAEGGGAQILTMGGVKAAAKLELFGGQIRALKDVQFAGQIGGEGVSIMTMGQILGGSKGELYGCGGTGMNRNFQPVRFALAR